MALDNHQSHMCLVNLASEQGKAKILIWEKQHKVGSNMSGVLLLKIIIRESHINSNAMTSVVRTKLASLDVCMEVLV